MKHNFALIILLCLSQLVIAREFSVDSDSNIQATIDGSMQDDDVLLFEPGEYELNITLNKNITLQGRSTKDVIFKPEFSDQSIITVNDAVGASIQNITFLDAEQAILVASDILAIDLQIKNNVFHLQNNGDSQTSNTAIKIGDNSGVSISNNVFYENDIAIFSEYQSNLIQQNIFDQNEIDIDNPLSDNVGPNCYGETSSDFADLSGSIKANDIEFVDVDNYDFHLQENSDCVTGSDSNEVEYGAYGGDEADEIPAAIKIETISSNVTAETLNVSLEWDHNKAREIAGYKLYYSASPLINLNSLDEREDILFKDFAIDQDEEIDDTLSETIDELDAIIEKPATPKLSVSPRDRKLLLQWTAVDNADSYLIYYTGQEDDPIRTQNTRYEISGLSNDLVYVVWVRAESQLTYYFQIAAYMDANSESNFAESFFINDDSELEVGEIKLSDESNKVSMQPEAIVAYPPLPNEGCFIATAAFGYYSADEVKVLRRFRDNYLLVSKPGAQFVSWYYEYGPHLANLIRQNDAIKTIVRWALLPLVSMVKVLEYSVVWFSLIIVLYVLLVFSLIGKLSRFIVRKI